MIKYINKPVDRYMTRIKSPNAIYTSTNYECPLCKGTFSKRNFDDHVFKTHGNRADECFAMLFGLPYPVRCSCGKELHYSRTKKGYPDRCGSCATGTFSKLEYKNAEDAHKHVEQLKQMLADAQNEEKRLKKEAQLSSVPINELPFPTRKDSRFLKRVSMSIRIHAVNGEKDKLIEIANIIDKMLEEK